ncbi:MAG: phosphoribosylaminoimidazolesuccinocarboxamide synthase [Oscillospiraceae bacterium]|nr:phosphoribosylaminoimidazolesuccinocarboxamide synthase [Oscillospiraceae bacterium]
MKQVFSGKTKTVFELPDGNYMLKFKDDACGKDGVFDPGENQVGLTIDGKGKAGLRLSEFFFKKINEAGFPTHFIGCDIDAATMTVRPATVFGKGLEVVCRFKATGSFVRRFGDYISDGAVLEPPLVEITLKDDNRGDPPVTRDIAVALGILTTDEFDKLSDLVRSIAGIIKNECAAKSLELIDMKLEFGRNKEGIMLIDEVSGDIMRVYDKQGNAVEPIELTRIICG